MRTRSMALVGALLLGVLAGCGGAPSDAQRAGDSQLALAATVAAGAPAPAALNTAAPAPTRAATGAPTLAPPTQVPPTAAPATQAPPTAAPPTAAPPTQVPPAIACDSPCSISFSELYAGASITGPILSDKARALSGKPVIMRGFMAPPLSPSTTFFVLTKDPMVYCPFCNTAADWPFDIVYVRMTGGRNIPTMVPTTNIAIRGTFEVGTWTDPETGFVSMVRIFADSVDPIS